jgi:hypothetical protein
MAGVSTGMVPEGDRVWSGQVLQRQAVVRRQCGASGREEPHDGRGGRYHQLQLDENEQGECVCVCMHARMRGWTHVMCIPAPQNYKHATWSKPCNVSTATITTQSNPIDWLTNQPTNSRNHSFIFLSFPTWYIGPLLGFLWSHIYLRHTVGLLWMSDQPVAETCTFTGQHNVRNTRDKHPCPQRDSNPWPQQLNGRRPTP